jgi:predicted PurR-regulated permease PerM
MDKLEKYADSISLIVAVSALILITWGCVIVLAPFIPALLWAFILCLTTWPAFTWLQKCLSGRLGLSAFLMTVFLAICFIAPILFLGSSLADDFSSVKNIIIETFGNEENPPPAFLTGLPVIGSVISDLWPLYLGDAKALLQTFQDHANTVSEFLLATGVTIGRGLIDLSLGILIAFFFFRHGDVVTARLNTLIDWLTGARGQRLVEVSTKTMIGVVYGVMGAALAQGTVAGIGFAIAGIPGAPFLGLLTFLFSFLPMGPSLIWIPASIWLFSEGQIGMGVFMIVWGLFVSSLDNIIRPYFISLGSALPLLLVLLGVFGGILAFGFIGLFIGPVLLAVAYSLIAEWSEPENNQIVT